MGYPPDTTTTATAEEQNATDAYLDVLLKVRTTFPDLTIEQQQGIADRALGGPKAFSLEYVEAVARELVKADGKVWEQQFTNAQNTYIGTALRALAAGEHAGT
jgi:hypothetical protein